MIPVFLWTTLQLYVQFLAGFHLYEWFSRRYIMPDPDIKVYGQWQKKIKTGFQMFSICGFYYIQIASENICLP